MRLFFGGGYSAGYYAYLWSEALAADAFAYCTENGGMTAANGARMRDAVLQRGLTRDPMAMFTAFRGRALDTKALLESRGFSEGNHGAPGHYVIEKAFVER